MLPYTLRDPYRISHYKSPAYRKLWPGAKNYLIALSDAANNAVLDMIMTGAAGLLSSMKSTRSMAGVPAGDVTVAMNVTCWPTRSTTLWAIRTRRSLSLHRSRLTSATGRARWPTW